MGELNPLIWPDKPAGLERHGLSLLLVALPKNIKREDARRRGRAVLRETLGNLLSLPMEQVPLAEGPLGPVLEDATRDIRISLSYAGGWVLIGLAEGRALGVDMVRIENLAEVEVLARLYLPAAACQEALAAPLEMRDARFAQAWAEMEAGCKCLGLPLAEIDAERERELKACDFLECRGVEGYCLAVAVCSGAGHPYRLMTSGWLSVA